MNHTPTTLVFVFFVMSMVATVQAQQCSNASAAGAWSFTTTGSIVGVGPVSAVGRFFVDAAGSIRGIQTRSVNGSIARETFTGTSKVNSDCTVTATIDVSQAGVLVRTTTLDLVLFNNQTEERAIFTSLTLPNGTRLPTVLTVEAKRLF